MGENNISDNFIRKIAHHQALDNEDIVHMMFVTPRGDRKCLVFCRRDDETSSKKDKKAINKIKNIKQGNIEVKIYTDHLHTDRDIQAQPIDLILRYENVHDQIKNLFAEFND